MIIPRLTRNIERQQICIKMIDGKDVEILAVCSFVGIRLYFLSFVPPDSVDVSFKITILNEPCNYVLFKGRNSA